ncbi:glycosyltransferase [Roseovarius salinarum]|uniref:glycosyltransferase n=1 Tax=Roseovarius salinarum TaxID=1981892 RepID=UPI000C322EB4|nr:glycosyltransferase [Roseovarius salinarum]
MRILFVSSETPLFPAGGIATYLEYMVPALKSQGHEVFLFTFREESEFSFPREMGSFDQDKVHIEVFRESDVHEQFPSRPHFQSLSFYLANRLKSVIDGWDIDVVEATDYQAPCLALFQALQVKKGAERRLFSTFHHGLSEVIFEADQIGYQDWARANNLAERQQMRVSDLVVVPSNASKDRLRSLDIQTQTRLVREPYAFRNEVGQANLTVTNDIQYIGRLSIQKGVDKLIYASNVLHSVVPLRRVELIGRVGFTPFREPDILKYCRARLRPELRDRLTYSDFKPREVVLDLLNRGAISPHLGTDETFSYACIEAIDAGQVPIVRHNTAMAEFFPEDLHDYILDSEMRSVRGLQEKFEKIIADGPQVVAQVQEYCRRTLDPNTVANTLGNTYSKALDRKRGWRAHAVPRQRAQIKDVTVLIPAYKPNHEFMETIDSIATQSAGIPNVLICDDGTPEVSQPWFEYAQALLPDCQIIKQPNAGLLASRNTLIEACTTSLSIFVDTDDLFAPTLLEHMLEAWNEAVTQPDAIIPQRRNFGEQNELILRNTINDYIHILENDFRMTALIRTDILREIGFDATRRNGEGDDWIFWLDFEGRGYRAVLLPEAGFLYRFRRGSMSWPWSEGQNVGTQTMLREVLHETLQREPDKSLAVTRAIFARAVSK